MTKLWSAATLNFNQLLFAISNRTEEYTYGSLAIAYNNKLPMYRYMNELRHIDDNYSATVLQICDRLIRGDVDKAQELIDYSAKHWGFIK